MLTKVQIGNRMVGEGEATFIIAEAGSNHDRNFEQATRLIAVAAEAGADAVKFQTYSADTLYSKKAPRLGEMGGRAKPGETPYELLKRIELPREWQKDLDAYSRERGILFLSTPFDEQAVDELEETGVPAYKVASYELVHLPLIRYIARTKKPMILSTGNSGLADIEAALEVIYEEGNTDVILLHCVSQYPAQYEDINLRVLATLRSAFEVPVGFSDHTMDSVSAIGAVALGATVVEKHFTVNRRLPGPDHPFSLEPGELQEFVRNIRKIEKALGNSIKRVMKSEEENHCLARGSIHAKVGIPKDTVISPEMITIKRPALGIKPLFLDIIIGRKAKRNIQEDEWITWEMV